MVIHYFVTHQDVRNKHHDEEKEARCRQHGHVYQLAVAEALPEHVDTAQGGAQKESSDDDEHDEVGYSLKITHAEINASSYDTGGNDTWRREQKEKDRCQN